MWRWLKRLLWWAVAAASVASALVSVLEYLEIKPPPQLSLPPELALPPQLLLGARKLTEIPPPVFLALAVLGVAVMLISHSMRLRRFEASWADMNERQWALFRNWLRERRREVDREINQVMFESQHPRWIDTTLGGRPVRLTAEAFSFYEGCHPRERQRIERRVSESGKDHFLPTEIRAMANDERE